MESTHEQLLQAGFECQLTLLREMKEKEGRSERARAIAVTITELEKAYAYFAVFVKNGVKDGTETSR